jgi:hypothetical protein
MALQRHSWRMALQRHSWRMALLRHSWRMALVRHSWRMALLRHSWRCSESRVNCYSRLQPLCDPRCRVFRVNCLDCNVRTNVVQAALALNALAMQMGTLGVCPAVLTYSSVCSATVLSCSQCCA